jgi:hypothetical protein
LHNELGGTGADAGRGLTLRMDTDLNTHPMISATN